MSDEKRALSEIDKNNLDEECVQFVKDYEDWATKLAEARAELEDAENALEVAKAEADLKIRDKSYPWKGIDKVTESTIRSTVILDTAVQEATKDLMEIKRLVEFTNAKVRGLDHKKSMIEKIVALRLASYYSEPQLPKGKEEIRSRISDEKRKKMYREKLREEVIDDNNIKEE